MSEFEEADDIDPIDEAIQVVRSLMDPKRLAIADRVAKLHNEYLPLDRDELLWEKLNALVASTSAPATGKPDKRRILAVVGRSGAGKTTALLKHTSRIKEMQPRVDKDGVKIYPTLFMEAASPCTPRLVAINGLMALGHTPPDRIRENEAWLLFRRLLKVHKVMFIVIDEAQNAIETASVREATVIGDAFKSLTQMPDWPVRLVLAGVPPLGSFLARKQLYNRRTVVPFDTLDAAGNTDLVREILTTIVTKHAEMQVDVDLDGDFLDRLMHACDAEFGSVVQMIRGAVELAILDERTSVLQQDFIRVYADFSGCRPSKNVFKADNWAELDPSTALLRAEDRAWEEERKRSKGRNATKYTVRPQ